MVTRITVCYGCVHELDVVPTCQFESMRAKGALLQYQTLFLLVGDNDNLSVVHLGEEEETISTFEDRHLWTSDGM